MTTKTYDITFRVGFSREPTAAEAEVAAESIAMHMLAQTVVSTRKNEEGLEDRVRVGVVSAQVIRWEPT